MISSHRDGADGYAELLQSRNGSIRIMEPGANPQYPNGYVGFTNEHNQPINLDGKPGTRAETHIPRNPDGSFPIPKGWP
ncbi:MAG: hypothetical protein QOJ20_2290 [Mycobacterium sp.]|jgi:hypothetical protein|nr:hypothetical protein [Mycobacterium sp.]